MSNLKLEVVSTSHPAVKTSRTTIAGRRSLFLSLEGPERRLSRGEASPLADFGSDSFEVAEAELSALREPEIRAAVAEVVDGFRGSKEEPGATRRARALGLLLSRTGAQIRSPSARFCVETLVVEAAAQECEVPLFRLLGDRDPEPSLPTSDVIDPLGDDYLAQARLRRERGFSALKLKCGRRTNVEIEAVRALRGEVPELTLRLDPNGAWTASEAERFLRALPEGAIEFVEDPSADLSAWPALRQATGVPLALDEPLARCFSGSPRAEELTALCRPDILVIKPMAVGGFSASLSLAGLARERGVRVSVSHLFDGPLALCACVHLAFSIQSEGLAPGLGLHAGLLGFAGTSWQVPQFVSSGRIDLPGK